MKIFYDHQIFTMQSFGGISKYIFELHKSKNFESEIYTKYTKNIYLKNNTLINKSQDNKYLNFIFRKLVWNLNEKYCIKKLKENKYDIFHPTYFNNYFLPLIQQKPYIITIYDTIHEIFPSYFRQNDKTALKRKELILAANRIIAISENTKKDIIRLYNIDPNTIDVIYLGYESIEQTTLLNNSQLPENYILFIGNRSRYKNFTFFITAVAEFLKSDTNLFLVCTGFSFTIEEKILFTNLGIKNKVKHIFFQESNLFTIYKHAKLFVYPSLYEGFGLPILDAFNAKCPTILSNASCFPEIAQDGALYFEVGNIDSLKTKINDLLTNNTLKEDLIKKATKRLEDFSWDNTREKTFSSYKKLLI